jgi:hypothetical protein
MNIKGRDFECALEASETPKERKYKKMKEEHQSQASSVS